jgi:tRNA A-37 threonylcarbamoyl transferase component Bud32
MTQRILATRPDPALVRLPWSVPLEEWGEDLVLPLPRGISRHVVRFVRVGDHTCAVKETEELIARKEYHLLRDLQRLGLPTVVPQAVVTGRKNAAGEWLPSALVTRQLRYSLPYRALFARGMRADSLPALLDALVVLLVRLHLAGFYWGDVSLSNVLFRRSAGEFAAYLVDAETGELRPELSARQRQYDVSVGLENVFAELLDLQAADLLEQHIEPVEVVDRITERYGALWDALTEVRTFGVDELWRVQQWVESLNELGFDVDEMDILTQAEDAGFRVHPRVVEAGHHSRELRTLTGLDVEEAQARRLLNDLAQFAAALGDTQEPREAVAHRWLTEIYEPLTDMMPASARARVEPAEFYHEVLVHRWYLSERAGREVDIFETASDYIENVLSTRPEEPPLPAEL